ncbi:MAG: rod shape-determining protein MreC [Deltaproteobacteria bacterium]
MEAFKKYGFIILVTTGIIAGLIFYSLNVPRSRDANFIERGIMTAFDPILKPAAQVSGFFEDIWDGYISLIDEHKKNLKLRDEIRDLNARLMEANEAVQANLRLTRLLDMKSNVNAPSLTATVVGEDVTSWFRTMIIDRGSSSGIRQGMAVISADGIAGQTVKVSTSTSRVLLMTDHASGIAAVIQRSRARGVVKGKGEGLCSMVFTNRDEDVKVGDQVVSSGIGGVFPKGLPIGEVTMVKRGEYGIFQTVTIRPVVNFSHLEEVLVVLRGGYE